MLNKPILYGKTITLRPITVEDSAALFAVFSDKECMRLTGTQKTFTFAQAEALVASHSSADDRADYAIVPNAEPDLVVGEVVLNYIDWTNRTSNFRICLVAEKYFGQGFGSQATKLILQYGFEQLDLHRIELDVYDFNPRAQHVYEKAGFVREGVMRDALLWDGVYHNAIMMSLLKPEYEKL